MDKFHYFRFSFRNNLKLEVNTTALLGSTDSDEYETAVIVEDYSFNFSFILYKENNQTTRTTHIEIPLMWDRNIGT